MGSSKAAQVEEAEWWGTWDLIDVGFDREPAEPPMCSDIHVGDPKCLLL